MIRCQKGRRRHPVVVLASLAVAVAVAACSSPGSSGSGTAAGGTVTFAPPGRYHPHLHIAVRERTGLEQCGPVPVHPVHVEAALLVRH